jgi:hypothetical protein
VRRRFMMLGNGLPCNENNKFSRHPDSPDTFYLRPSTKMISRKVY